MKYFWSIIFVIFCMNAKAKTDSTELEIIKIVNQMFDAMRIGDSSMLRPIFTPDATLSTIIEGRNGETILKKGEPIQNFIHQIGTPHKDLYDEQIYNYDLKIDDRYASVWTPYSFFLNGKLNHCGINHFQLLQKNGSWLIFSITDTRRKNNCTDAPTAAINALMNAWHKAAAVADEDTFFGSMTPDAYYIGTDQSERWKRDELKSWSKKFFDRDTAWSFTPLKRNLFFSNDQKYAWFDETLDTWMGICRGSGVVRLTEEGWKIEQFVLSICVPNDVVNNYLDLIGKPKKK